ncbi:MAG: hypothetical protein ABJO67_10240 [Pseudoruegeria sp.]
MACAIRKILTGNPAEFDPRTYLAPSIAAMKSVCEQGYESFGAEGHGSAINALGLPEMVKTYYEHHVSQTSAAL